MDYYKEHNLKEIGEVITGKTPPTKIKEYYADVGAPFYTPSDYKDDHKYLKNTARKVSHKALQKFDNYIIPPKSIMVTCIGSDMGKVVLNDEDGMTNQQINSLIVDKKEFSTDYIYYALKRLYPQLRKLGEGSGSTMPIINKTNFSNISLSLPPLPEQKRIADILSSFDNKIELLREQNKTLENIAQTIFKQWFIDFNFPDSNGKPYKDNGGKMKDSELGIIPEGWEVETLSKIAELIMGQSPPSSSYNEDKIGLPLLNGAQELTETKVLKSKYTTEPTKVSQIGDILFCIRATIGNIHFSDTDYCLGRGVAALRPLEDLEVFMFYLLKDSLSRISKQASGSVIKGLTKKMIQDFKFPYLFDTDSLYNQRIQSLQEKTKLNKESIETLRSTKNILLNKLIQ